MSGIDKNMSNIDLNGEDVQLSLITAVRQPCSPDWNWDCRGSGYDEGNLIWLVEGGKAELSSPFGEFSVRRGDFFFMPGGHRHSYWGRHNPETPLVVSWIHAQFSIDGGIQSVMPDQAGIPFYIRLRDYSFPACLMKRIIATRGNEQKIWFRALLNEVSAQYRLGQVSTAEQAVEKLCAAICQDPGRYHTLEDMPFDFHCSKDHFIRLFKKCRGVTPGEFLIQTRIEVARQLLTVPNLSIKEIAAQLGYPDSCSFSKQFKLRTGHPPSLINSRTAKTLKRQEGLTY